PPVLHARAAVHRPALRRSLTWRRGVRSSRDSNFFALARMRGVIGGAGGSVQSSRLLQSLDPRLTERLRMRSQALERAERAPEHVAARPHREYERIRVNVESLEDGGCATTHCVFARPSLSCGPIE